MLNFYKKNLERLKSLSLDCPQCIQNREMCHHYDYLRDYIKELEDLPPFDCEKFETFWKEYPVKKAKSVAIKSWNKLKIDNDLFLIIMTAVKNHKKSIQWVKDNGQFIPMPSTWLNQRRWEDELEITNQKSTKYKNI